VSLPHSLPVVHVLAVGQKFMKQNKLASQILRLLDERTRKKIVIKTALLMFVVFFAHLWSNRWDSPLALIPRTMTGVIFGALCVYLNSIFIYPRISKYFDTELLKIDAEDDSTSA